MNRHTETEVVPRQLLSVLHPSVRGAASAVHTGPTEPCNIQQLINWIVNSFSKFPTAFSCLNCLGALKTCFLDILKESVVSQKGHWTAAPKTNARHYY